MLRNRFFAIAALSAAVLVACAFAFPPTSFSVGAEPVRIIFDTDIGNDVDDAMALAVIHALQNRNECELLAITTTKDNPFAPKMAALLNTFYGRPGIPIAVVRDGMTKQDGNYNRQVVELKDESGKPLYPFTLPPDEELPEAVSFLRKTLAAEKDAGVVLIQVGFFTNFARLLDTPGDAISPLTGKELVTRKVRSLSLMAGDFTSNPGPEFNVRIDIPAAKKVVENWPTEMIYSGFEIGMAVQHPAASMREDYGYVPHHPLRDAYHYYRGLENEQPTFDLTSVLYVARPNRGYFTLSEPGTVKVLDDGRTRFVASADGKHRYMKIDPVQTAMIREAFVQLCSEPPK